ncbi:MAG: hypothetical protein ACOYL6_07165 [Bacteriovoracaceae bacterium]
MKMKFMLVSLVLCLGLNAEASHLTRMTKKAERKLKVDIQYNDQTVDECVDEQITKLVKDFKKADKDLKKLALLKLEGKSLIFGNTVSKGAIKGQMIFLDLYTYMMTSNTGPMAILIDRKVVSDKRENLNLVTMNDVLGGGTQIHMNLFKVENSYTSKYYSTYSRQAFTGIIDETTLRTYQEDGYLLPRPMILEGGVDFSKYSCGTLTLKEFLTKIF